MNNYEEIARSFREYLDSLSTEEIARVINETGGNVYVGDDGFIHSVEPPPEPDMLDKLSTQVELLVKKGDDYLADFLREVTSHIVHLQMDHDYYQAVVEGKWPNSDDIIKRSRGQSDDTQTRVDES